MSLQYQLNVQSDEDYFTTAMELNPFFREQSLYIFDMSWIKDSNRFEAFRNGYFSGKYRFFQLDSLKENQIPEPFHYYICELENNEVKYCVSSESGERIEGTFFLTEKELQDAEDRNLAILKKIKQNHVTCEQDVDEILKQIILIRQMPFQLGELLISDMSNSPLGAKNIYVECLALFSLAEELREILSKGVDEKRIKWARSVNWSHLIVNLSLIAEAIREANKLSIFYLYSNLFKAEKPEDKKMVCQLMEQNFNETLLIYQFLINFSQYFHFDDLYEKIEIEIKKVIEAKKSFTKEHYPESMELELLEPNNVTKLNTVPELGKILMMLCALEMNFFNGDFSFLPTELSCNESDKGQSSESGLLNNTVLAEALTNAFATLYSIRTSKNISLNDFEKAQRICQTWKEYFLEKDSKDSTRDFVLFNVLAQLFQKVEGHFLTKWKKQISDKLRPARLVTFKCWISDIVSDDQEKSQLTIKKMNEVLDKEFDDFLEEDKEHYFNGVLLMLEKLLEEKKTSSSLKGVLLLNTTIFRYHRSLLDEDLMSVAGVYLKNINNLVKTSISRTLTDLERSSWNCYHKAFFESFAQYCTLFDTILKTEDNEFYFRLNTTYDVFFNIFELLKVLKIADESKIKILHHSFDEFLNRYSSSLFSSFQSDEEGINSKLPDSIFSLAVLANLELKQHKEWLISMVSPSVEPSKTLIAQFHMVNANLKKAASWADFVRNFNLSASLLVLAMTDPKSNEKLITACQEHILAWKKFFTSRKELQYFSEKMLPFLSSIEKKLTKQKDQLLKNSVDDLSAQFSGMKLSSDSPSMSKSQRRKMKRVQIPVPASNPWIVQKLEIVKKKRPNITGAEFIKHVFNRCHSVIEEIVKQQAPPSHFVYFYENFDGMRESIIFYTNWIATHSQDDTFDDLTKNILDIYETLILQFNEVLSIEATDDLLNNLWKYIDYRKKRGADFSERFLVLRLDYLKLIPHQDEFSTGRTLLSSTYSLKLLEDGEVLRASHQQEVDLPLQGSVNADNFLSHLGCTMEKIRTLLSGESKYMKEILPLCDYWLKYFDEPGNRQSLFNQFIYAKILELRRQVDEACCKKEKLFKWFKAATKLDPYQRKQKLDECKDCVGLSDERTFNEFLSQIESDDCHQSIKKMLLINQVVVKHRDDYVQSHPGMLVRVFRAFLKSYRSFIDFSLIEDNKDKINWHIFFSNMNDLLSAYNQIVNYMLRLMEQRVSGLTEKDDPEMVLSYICQVIDMRFIYEQVFNYYCALHDCENCQVIKDELTWMQSKLNSFCNENFPDKGAVFKNEIRVIDDLIIKMSADISDLKSKSKTDIFQTICTFWEFATYWKDGICIAKPPPECRVSYPRLGDLSSIQSVAGLSQYLTHLCSYYHSLIKANKMPLPYEFFFELEMGESDSFPILKRFIKQTIEKIEHQFSRKRQLDFFEKKVQEYLERFDNPSMMANFIEDAQFQSPRFFRCYANTVMLRYQSISKNNLSSYLRRILIYKHVVKPFQHLFSADNLKVVLSGESASISGMFEFIEKTDGSIREKNYPLYQFVCENLTILQRVVIEKIEEEISNQSGMQKKLPQILNKYVALFRFLNTFSTNEVDFADDALNSLHAFVGSFSEDRALVCQKDTDLVKDRQFLSSFVELSLMSDKCAWNGGKYGPLNTKLRALNEGESPLLSHEFVFSRDFLLMVRVLKAYAQQDKFEQKDCDDVRRMISEVIECISRDKENISLIRISCKSWLTKLNERFNEKLSSQVRAKQKSKSIQKKPSIRPQRIPKQTHAPMPAPEEVVILGEDILKPPRKFVEPQYSSEAEKRKAKELRRKERQAKIQASLPPKPPVNLMVEQKVEPSRYETLPPPIFNHIKWSQRKDRKDKKSKKIEEIQETQEVEELQAAQEVEKVQDVQEVQDVVEVQEVAEVHEACVPEDEKVERLGSWENRVEEFWSLTPESVRALFDTANQHNVRLFLTGGAIRNWLLRLPILDLDFVIEEPDVPINTLFPEAIKLLEAENTYRITTPEGIEIDLVVCKKGFKLHEDAKKRDAKINAFYMDKEHLYGMKVALEELYYLPLTMVNPPKEFFEMNQKSILRMLTLPHGAKRELDATVIEAIKEKANLVKKINYFELRVLVKKLLSYGTLALQDLYKFKLIHQLIPSQYHECLDNSAVDYNILFHNVVLDREMAMAVLLFPLCAGETSVKQVVDDFMKPYKSEDNKLTIYEKNMLDLYSEHIEKRLETLLSKYKEAQRRAQQRAQRNAQRKTQQRKAKARGQPSQQRGQPLDFAYQASRGRSMRGQPSSTRGQPSNLTQESLTAQMPDQGQPSNYYSRGSVYRRGRGRA